MSSSNRSGQPIWSTTALDNGKATPHSGQQAKSFGGGRTSEVEFIGSYQDGTESEWFPETEVLDSSRELSAQGG